MNPFDQEQLGRRKRWIRNYKELSLCGRDWSSIREVTTHVQFLYIPPPYTVQGMRIWSKRPLVNRWRNREWNCEVCQWGEIYSCGMGEVFLKIKENDFWVQICSLWFSWIESHWRKWHLASCCLCITFEQWLQFFHPTPYDPKFFHPTTSQELPTTPNCPTPQIGSSAIFPQSSNISPYINLLIPQSSPSLQFLYCAP